MSAFPGEVRELICNRLLNGLIHASGPNRKRCRLTLSELAALPRFVGKSRDRS